MVRPRALRGAHGAGSHLAARARRACGYGRRCRGGARRQPRARSAVPLSRGRAAHGGVRDGVRVGARPCAVRRVAPPHTALTLRRHAHHACRARRHVVVADRRVRHRARTAGRAAPRGDTHRRGRRRRRATPQADGDPAWSHAALGRQDTSSVAAPAQGGSGRLWATRHSRGVLTGRDQATARPATASGARAHRLQPRRCHLL